MKRMKKAWQRKRREMIKLSAERKLTASEDKSFAALLIAGGYPHMEWDGAQFVPQTLAPIVKVGCQRVDYTFSACEIRGKLERQQEGHISIKSGICDHRLRLSNINSWSLVPGSNCMPRILFDLHQTSNFRHH